MTETTAFSIHTQQDNGTDGVRFEVMVRRGAKTWEYSGVATRSALLALGPGNDLQVIFDANRTKFYEGIKQAWNDEMPSTAKYIVNSENYQDGGGFVNNG